MARRQRTQEAAVATAEAREPGDEVAREPFPPMRPWAHDNVAGVELLSYSDKATRTYQTMIKFRDGKPTQEVRALMKEAGYRWAGDAPQGGNFNVEGAWVRDNKGPDLAVDRETGRRTFAKVVDQIYQEKGIEREPEGKTPF